MKKDKIIIISMIVVMMFGLMFLAIRPIKEVLGWGNPSTAQNRKGKSKVAKDLREELPDINAINFSEVDQKSTCFGIDKKTFEVGNMIIPGESLFVEEITYPGKQQIGTPDSYVLYQYDLVTEKLVHEFDLEQAFEEELEAGYELPLVLKFETIKGRTEPVISSILFSENEGEDLITFIIDPKSGELNTLREYPFDLFEAMDYSAQSNYYIFTDEDFKKAQGFDEELFIQVDVNDVLFASFSGASITKDTEELVKHFPNLKEYAGNPDTYFLIYFTAGYQEEDVMNFFKPTKDKSFVPYTMAKEYAIDKQPHEITSFADYAKWSEFSYENMGNVEDDLDDIENLMDVSEK